MKKQFILLYGPPGVGKTSVGQLLYQMIDQSMHLDVDHLWDMHPFVVNEDNKEMVESNIVSVIEHFLDNPSLDTLIVSWVVHTKSLYEFFDLLTRRFDDRLFVRLTADNQTLIHRMRKQGRSEENINHGIGMVRLYPSLEDQLIDTTNCLALDCAKMITSIIKNTRI